MRTLLLSLSLFAAACGSLRELSPDTAASRISSSDGYKAEACAMAQHYADRIGEYRWSDVQAVAPIDPEELTHMQAVFALKPSISCRLKVDKYFYDLGSKALYELTAAVASMQVAYEAIRPGGSLADCETCTLADYSPSGLLVSYYRAPIFAEARSRHAARFADLCLDVENAEQHAAAINEHAAHGEPRLNPLFDRHGGCDWVFKTVYAREGGSCARFGENPYMICDHGVWRTDTGAPRPMTYFPQGYRKLDWFGAGFVLALADGAFDVYWLENGRLNHNLGGPASPARIADVDQDNRNDAVMGDFLVLSRRGGTGTRTTVSALQASREAGERERKVRQFEADFAVLPLADVEQLLGGEYAGHPDLLDRAAEVSYEGWQSAAEEQRATLERIEVYWHAALWNGVAAKHAIDPNYLPSLLAATAPDRAEERRAALAAARKNGEAAKLYAECSALRQEAASRVENLEAAATGTAAAEAAVGALWQRYRGQPMPTRQIGEALEAAKRNQADLEAFLNATCL